MTSLCSKRWTATDVALLTARGSTGAQGFYKGVSLVEKASAFGSTSAGVRARTGSLKRFDLFFARIGEVLPLQPRDKMLRRRRWER